jgi:site-specific recombinase XerD
VADINAASIAENWYEFLRQKGKSQHTSQAYHRGVHHFIQWYEQVYKASLELNLVMPRDVRNWQSYMRITEKAAPATINLRIVALSRFFAWTVQAKLCRENPTEDVSTIRLDARQPKALEPDHLRRLLRAAKANLRDYAILEIMAGTGLRVGELLALHVGDVKLGERSGSVIVRQGKQGNYREIPLTVDVRKAVSAYLNHEHSSPLDPDAPLWLGRKGSLNQRSSIKRMLEKYAYIAKIHPPSPHVLRHTFATRYLAANPDDIRGLARLLGHANLNTVMIYTEPDMNSLTQRMERVEALVD